MAGSVSGRTHGPCLYLPLVEFPPQACEQKDIWKEDVSDRRVPRDGWEESKKKKTVTLRRSDGFCSIVDLVGHGFSGFGAQYCMAPLAKILLGGFA